MCANHLLFHSLVLKEATLDFLNLLGHVFNFHLQTSSVMGGGGVPGGWGDILTPQPAAGGAPLLQPQSTAPQPKATSPQKVYTVDQDIFTSKIFNFLRGLNFIARL